MRHWKILLLLTAFSSACSFKQGETGALGATGTASLIRMEASPTCKNGGTSLKTGNDTNGNGQLDDQEVLYATSVCQGSPDSAEQILEKLTSVDGAGSGLDADRLRGVTPEEMAPPGAVLAFAGSEAPVGWLACDGQAVSRAQYARLFQVIGTQHGEGDASTTFNLPDYRGRFLRGVDGTAKRDPGRDARTPAGPGGSSGNSVGSVQTASTALPASPFFTDTVGNHSHANGAFNSLVTVNSQYTINSAVDNVNATGSEFNLIYSAPMVAAGAHGHAVASGGDAETRPLNAYVQYVIKY